MRRRTRAITGGLSGGLVGDVVAGVLRSLEIFDADCRIWMVAGSACLGSAIAIGGWRSTMLIFNEAKIPESQTHSPDPLRGRITSPCTHRRTRCLVHYKQLNRAAIAMDSNYIVELSRDAIVITLTVASPVLVTAVVVGLGISLIQAMTQIQDQTISFVPKIVAMLIACLYALPWALDRIMNYSTELIQNIPKTL